MSTLTHYWLVGAITRIMAHRTSIGRKHNEALAGLEDSGVRVTVTLRTITIAVLLRPWRTYDGLQSFDVFRLRNILVWKTPALLYCAAFKRETRYDKGSNNEQVSEAAKYLIVLFPNRAHLPAERVGQALTRAPARPTLSGLGRCASVANPLCPALLFSLKECMTTCSRGESFIVFG